MPDIKDFVIDDGTTKWKFKDLSDTNGWMTEQDKANLDSIFHQPSTKYNIGDQVHVAEFPSYIMLKCIQAGTTDSMRPDFANIDISSISSATSGWIDGFPIASTSSAGLMSSSDKVKLDNINTSTYATKEEINGLSSIYAKLSDISTISGGASYSVATTTNDGLMSSSDKIKLDDLYNESIKTDGYLTLNIDEIVVFQNNTREINVIASSGTITSVTSLNTNIVSISLSNDNKTITCTGGTVGTTQLKFIVSRNDEYKQLTKVVNISCKSLDLNIFNSTDINSFSDLREVIRRGLASNYMVPGSYVEVDMAWPENQQWAEGYTPPDKILAKVAHIDYDPNVEGNNRITFIMPTKSSNLVDSAFQPAGLQYAWRYSESGESTWITETLWAALPQGLKDVVVKVSKDARLYKNCGDESISGMLWLLSATEVRGKIQVYWDTWYEGSFEKGYIEAQRFDYFNLGNVTDDVTWMTRTSVNAEYAGAYRGGVKANGSWQPNAFRDVGPLRVGFVIG